MFRWYFQIYHFFSQFVLSSTKSFSVSLKEYSQGLQTNHSSPYANYLRISLPLRSSLWWRHLFTRIKFRLLFIGIRLKRLDPVRPLTLYTARRFMKISSPSPMVCYKAVRGSRDPGTKAAPPRGANCRQRRPQRIICFRNERPWGRIYHTSTPLLSAIGTIMLFPSKN